MDDSLASVRRSGEQAVALAGSARRRRMRCVSPSNRYRAGYSSYLEQLDAQRGLLTAELALAEAQANQLTAYITLYQAMGAAGRRMPFRQPRANRVAMERTRR